MNDFMAMDLSSAGMRVQRQRMQVIAENLANQHTTGPDGPYQRKQVLLGAVPLFEDDLGAALQDGDPPVQSVAVTAIRSDGSEPLRVFNPSHPMADRDGYVSMPNVQPMREMTDMIEASRSYEANLAASQALREMMTAALDLIRG